MRPQGAARTTMIFVTRITGDNDSTSAGSLLDIGDTMTQENNTTSALSPISRRSLVKAAAWSAPAVAVAVSVPLAAATTVFDSPTAAISGAINVKGSSTTTRSATYSGGTVEYYSAGSAVANSGTLTLTITNSNLQFTTVLDDVKAAYIAAGWVVSGTPTQALIVFTHTPITSSTTITMPTITWNAPVGSSKGKLLIAVESDNDDVNGTRIGIS